jgi:hypothetical protein
VQGDYAKRRLSARTRAEQGANAHPLPQEDAGKRSAFGAETFEKGTRNLAGFEAQGGLH